jgi:hypothetical protein
MLLRPLPTAHGHLHPALSRYRLRRHLARLLRHAATRLLLTARRMAGPRPVPRFVASDLPHIEFHADAGAPEGALYVDGDYVGKLDVGRL